MHGGDTKTASSTDSGSGPLVRSTVSQLPPVGSGDARVLSQLTSLTPTGFEAAVVSIFRELDEVRHNITRTRPTADGGFDFVGTFTLPPPIQYEIPFLGEAKRYARSTAVGPKDVSRLVARLARGQYGIFVTTSYYTKQTQEEVLEDRYPTTLVAGADLVSGSCARCASRKTRRSATRGCDPCRPISTLPWNRCAELPKQSRRTRPDGRQPRSSSPNNVSLVDCPIAVGPSVIVTSSRFGQFGSQMRRVVVSPSAS